MRNLIISGLLLVVLLAVSSCRHDELVIPSESEQVGVQDKTSGGFYLLNEGNMGSNKCSIDYYDYSTGTYSRNIYAEKNPGEAMELGDVGNDIAVYGSKLYISVNCSHKVEVLDAATGIKLAKIDIPNCRFIKFHKDYAYVSSYIGPVGADPDCPLGAVFKIDTLTMTVKDKIAVGYQPEEMEIIDDCLYVANSGGYRAPEYDNTISVINLNNFTREEDITADINLLRLRKDRYGRLWATSRGNNKDIPSSLLLLEKSSGAFKLKKKFDVRCENIAVKGDSLLYFSSGRNNGSQNEFGIIDITSEAVRGKSFITDGTDAEIEYPYGMAVHPVTGDIYVTDAKNFVSSGTLFCYSSDGKKKWHAKTGDIPTAIAFTSIEVSSESGNGSQPEEDLCAYISRVYEYCPAPGQFINIMPRYEEGDSEEDMIRKCQESIAGKNNTAISLGGFGGYVTFGFDHLVENREGEYDFRLWGNSVWQSEEIRGGSCEPGIVMVSYDANGNGLPDDEWYELAGSEYNSPATRHNYEMTYQKPAAGKSPVPVEGLYSDSQYISWTDSFGKQGWMAKNLFHTQSYWPAWVNSQELKFKGTLLAPNAVDANGDGSNFILYSYGWGYADNYPNYMEAENSFDISWAVDSSGRKVALPGIHFVRVNTGMNQQCGWTGESSTEISMAKDLHYPL